MKKIIYLIIIANVIGTIGAMLFVNSDHMVTSRVLMGISLVLNITWVYMAIKILLKKTS